MTRPRLLLSLPDVKPNSAGVHNRFAPLVILLESLTQINVWHLKRAIAEGKPYPRLYDSGVYYREEKPGHEDWPDIPNVLMQGWADCEDLAAYLAAERRVYDGVHAEPVIKWKWIPSEELRAAGYPNTPRDGIYLVHCLVRYPDGSIEDPSKELGMKGEYS